MLLDLFDMVLLWIFKLNFGLLILFRLIRRYGGERVFSVGEEIQLRLLFICGWVLLIMNYEVFLEKWGRILQ